MLQLTSEKDQCVRDMHVQKRASRLRRHTERLVQEPLARQPRWVLVGRRQGQRCVEARLSQPARTDHNQDRQLEAAMGRSVLSQSTVRVASRNE